VRDGDFNVIARGATSLIAKEVRGIQIDTLVATMQPQEWAHVDERKLIESRFSTRDLQDLLIPAHEAKARASARAAEAQRRARRRPSMERELLGLKALRLSMPLQALQVGWAQGWPWRWSAGFFFPPIPLGA
jgi:hypothetical protein